MTISTVQQRVSYSGDASTTAFSVPFRFLASSDLTVVLHDDALGTDALQVITTHYTVTGAGDDAGGTVTMVAAPAVGKTLVIFGDPDLTQLTDYTEGDPFPAETHETALDRLTLQQKRTRELAERTPTLPDGDTDGTGAYDANSNRIKNLTDPVANQDADTKLARDNAIAAAGITPTPNITATGSTTARNVADRFAEVRNVKDFGAQGDGATDDATAIQAAITAAETNGGIVYFPDHATYVINSGLTVDSDDVILDFAGSTLKMAGASNYRAIFFQGAIATATDVTANQIIGDRTLTVVSAAGLAVGNYLVIHEGVGGGSSHLLVAMITGIAALVITIDTPLPFAVTAANTNEMSKLTPIERCGVRDLRLDMSAATGTDLEGLSNQYVANSRFERIQVIGGANGWGLLTFIGYGNVYRDIACDGAGGGDNADANVEIARESQTSVENIRSVKSSKFGPIIALCAYTSVRDVHSHFAGFRGFKAQQCAMCFRRSRPSGIRRQVDRIGGIINGDRDDRVDAAPARLCDAYRARRARLGDVGCLRL